MFALCLLESKFDTGQTARNVITVFASETVDDRKDGTINVVGRGSKSGANQAHD